jgi:hypothetical protein
MPMDRRRPRRCRGAMVSVVLVMGGLVVVGCAGHGRGVPAEADRGQGRAIPTLVIEVRAARSGGPLSGANVYLEGSQYPGGFRSLGTSDTHGRVIVESARLPWGKVRLSTQGSPCFESSTDSVTVVEGRVDTLRVRLVRRRGCAEI